MLLLYITYIYYIIYYIYILYYILHIYIVLYINILHAVFYNEPYKKTLDCIVVFYFQQ